LSWIEEEVWDMMTPAEREEIRQEVYRDVADLEDEIAHRAGSYTYLCLLMGEPVFTHFPVGRVLRHI
jgi:hypothetical protein